MEKDYDQAYFTISSPEHRTIDKQRYSLIPITEMKSESNIKTILDEQYGCFNTPSFIESDPIQIPHRFKKREDIEISALLTSTIAWGNRKSIIASASRMMSLMENDPFAFVINSHENDLKKIKGFAHRTFQSIDLIFFIKSLKNIYQNHGGLESVFSTGYKTNRSVRDSLIHFREVFFEIEHPLRTMKHISDVSRGSAGKRLNLFLMWMIRKDVQKVHFGLWKKIPPSALYIPLDVHCENIARRLGLLTRKQNDWKAVEELTAKLRSFDPNDPIKYDFALFCMGVHHVSCS
jgi:uncharacterized protein (TIGR02757 family)